MYKIVKNKYLIITLIFLVNLFITGSASLAAESENNLPVISDEQLLRIMDEAQKAMISGDYNAAIEMYSKILQYPKNIHSQKSLELLGLAHEKRFNLSQAIAEYKRYLSLYPEGEGADRVRQRLAGLETASMPTNEKLKKPANNIKESTTIFGGFTQSYYRDVSDTEFENSTIDRSSIFSNLDLQVRHRSQAYDIQSVLIIGHQYDLLRDSEDETRLNRMYIDVLKKEHLITARLGRQSASTGGVLGRFDGVKFGLNLSRAVKINMVGGIPIDTSKLSNYKTNRYFYGLNLDIGRFAEKWDFNSFIITQMIDGIKDREAVGGEVRYFYKNRSFFSLVDYDIYFKELNIFLLTCTVTLFTDTTLTISLNRRKNPILTTSNSIIGQNIESPAELLDSMPEEEIINQAKDLTSTSNTYTIGANHQINEDLQIGVDMMITKSGSTIAYPSSGLEYFYGTQIIRTDLIKEGDLLVGLRIRPFQTSGDFVPLFWKMMHYGMK